MKKVSTVAAQQSENFSPQKRERQPICFVRRKQSVLSRTLSIMAGHHKRVSRD